MVVEGTVKEKSLPFGAGYAKSSRSNCKGCDGSISENSLRMSVREPSRFFDGLQDNWFHFSCFWKKLKPGKTKINERSIRGMDILKWDDQERIREKMKEFVKYSTSGAAPLKTTFAVLKVEYAKTNKGKCVRCKEAVSKGQIKFGLHTGWYHQQCLFDNVVFGGYIEEMNGFSYLSEEDQNRLLQDLRNFTLSYLDDVGYEEEEEITDAKETIIESKKRKCVKDDNDEAPFKRRKKESKDVSNANLLKTQSNLLWQYRKDIRDNLTKNEMIELLIGNGQKIPEGDGIFDHLADCMVFGVCLPCLKCGGQLSYSLSLKTYKCDGQLSESTRCNHRDSNPPRKKFVIPNALKKKNKYLKEIKTDVLEKRVYNEAIASEEVVGRSNQFRKLGSRGIRGSGEVGHVYGKSLGVGSGMSQQLVKDGTIIDQECVYADVSHVYRKNGVLCSVVLGSVDAQANRNSFYKIQLLKHDKNATFYLFRSWGRVGTVIGGTRTERFHNEVDAVEAFERLFYEKSGNKWENKENFKKLPGRMDLVDTDLSVKEKNPSTIKPGSLSKLHETIKNLLLMIFDNDQMKTQMLQFQLDLDKMPLGRLSKKQLTNAYSVLTELQTLMEKQMDRDKILDASNRFYTLIPHSFGMRKPPLLQSAEMIKEKCAMLDSLLDLQIAYQVIKEDAKEEGEAEEERDPVDVHFEKLNCKMEVVERDSLEFKNIKTYLDNTHGATHTMFELEIVDIVRIERSVEKEKFKADIGNRMLLWHGSVASNYGGILSQGLRIAPPEAPVTGYMFGKGVYFADMSSKAANYCKVLTDDTDGLLLLCDVALGKIKPELDAKSYTMKKLKGFNSVQGLGKSDPDPKETIKSEEGYAIPLGKPVAANQDKDCSLLYNEFVVYDVNQIRLRYIVKSKFKMNLL